jgi:hypothetical protein
MPKGVASISTKATRARLVLRLAQAWLVPRREQRSLLVDPASSLTCRFATFARSFAVALKNRRARERRLPGACANTTRHAEHTASGQFIGSVGFLTNARWRGWHAGAASGRFSIGPLMQLAERDSSRGASCSTTAPPTEMRHDIVLRNKACGDTCACADHGGDRLVCAKPAAILHPALRRVGGARGALLLNPPRARPTSGWIAREPGHAGLSCL